MKFRKRIFARLYAVLARLSSAILEIWKTFPEPVRTALLIFAAGAAMFWNRQAPQTQPEASVAKIEVVHTSKDSSKTATQSPDNEMTRRPVKKVAKTRLSGAITNSPLTTPTNSTEAEARAREALSYGNYAEAYRQYRSAAEALPDSQKQAIAQQLEESARKNERGDFREAALRLERLFAFPTPLNK